MVVAPVVGRAERDDITFPFCSPLPPGYGVATLCAPLFPANETRDTCSCNADEATPLFVVNVAKALGIVVPDASRHNTSDGLTKPEGPEGDPCRILLVMRLTEPLSSGVSIAVYNSALSTSFEGPNSLLFHDLPVMPAAEVTGMRLSSTFSNKADRAVVRLFSLRGKTSMTPDLLPVFLTEVAEVEMSSGLTA